MIDARLVEPAGIGYRNALVFRIKTKAAK